MGTLGVLIGVLMFQFLAAFFLPMEKVRRRGRPSAIGGRAASWRQKPTSRGAGMEHTMVLRMMRAAAARCTSAGCSSGGQREARCSPWRAAEAIAKKMVLLMHARFSATLPGSCHATPHTFCRLVSDNSCAAAKRRARAKMRSSARARKSDARKARDMRCRSARRDEARARAMLRRMRGAPYMVW